MRVNAPHISLYQNISREGSMFITAAYGKENIFSESAKGGLGDEHLQIYKRSIKLSFWALAKNLYAGH